MRTDSNQKLLEGFTTPPFFVSTLTPTTLTPCRQSLQQLAATWASALSLDLASKIVTVLDCGIEDLLEVVDN